MENGNLFDYGKSFILIMRSTWRSKLIQIEITNACINQCANCTRCVGHHPKPFFMDMKTVEEALDSLGGFQGEVGIMGGEPLLHPQFKEICELLVKKVPDRRRRGLWTSGFNWDKHEDTIKATFDKDLIVYNEHSTDGGIHQPLLVAMKDVISDKSLREELKDNCWIQRRWETCSVTPYGVYFCEVAAALDILLNEGKNAVPIASNWWKNIKVFKDQYQICDQCGAPIPIGGVSDRATFDLISPSNLKKLKAINSPKVIDGNYALYKKRWTKEELIKKSKDWEPWNWRSFYAYGPEDYHRDNKT